jgi:gluconolactonase
MPAADVDVLARGFGFVEGPALLPDHGIAFCDVTHGVVLRFSDEGIDELATVGGRPNGLALGADGALVVAQMGDPWNDTLPSIQVIGRDGTVSILSAAPGLVAPNDLAYGPDGLLWITDSGDHDHIAPERPARILALEPDGALSATVELDPCFANGIAFDHQGRLIWTETATRRVRRWSNGETTTLAELPPDYLPDGLAIAEDGRIFVATLTSGGIDVLSPDGEWLDHLAVGYEPSNCAFLGSALIVTASSDSSGQPGTGVLLALTTDALPLSLHTVRSDSANRAAS